MLRLLRRHRQVGVVRNWVAAVAAIGSDQSTGLREFQHLCVIWYLSCAHKPAEFSSSPAGKSSPAAGLGVQRSEYSSADTENIIIAAGEFALNLRWSPS